MPFSALSMFFLLPQPQFLFPCGLMTMRFGPIVLAGFCHILCALDPALLFDLFFRVRAPAQFPLLLFKVSAANSFPYVFLPGLCRQGSRSVFHGTKPQSFMQCAGHRPHTRSLTCPLCRRVFSLRRIKPQDTASNSSPFASRDTESTMTPSPNSAFSRNLLSTIYMSL